MFDKSLRVLHFAETLYGGLATYLNELIPYQQNAYGEVVVFCPSSQSKLLASTGVRIAAYPDCDRTPLGLAKLYRYWLSHVHANRYDVIHLHSTFAGLIGRTTLSKQNARIVYCAHGWAHAMKVSRLKKWVYASVESILGARTDAIVNISRSESSHARAARLPESRLFMVYNGLQDCGWSQIPEDAPRRLLFVGRFDRQKGLDLLLRAMPELAAHGFSLTLIGGPVVGSASDIALPEGVRNLGWQPGTRIQQEMKEAAIVIMPSRWEGFGYVAVEAMRAGRPVLAADVGGLPELVVDGVTGRLCAPESPEAIVEGVLALAESNLPVLGCNARERFERLFKAERMFSQLDSIYSGKVQDFEVV
jgi:glycosyltransferase involved in cell wall biosynthesis